MTCREFQNKVVDWKRTGDQNLDARLAAHAAACPVCSRLLTRHAHLSEELAELRASFSAEEASPRNEQVLLARLAMLRSDQSAVAEQRARPRFVLALAAMFVLACGAAIGVFYFRAEPPRSGQPGVGARVPTVKIPQMKQPTAPGAAAADTAGEIMVAPGGEPEKTATAVKSRVRTRQTVPKASPAGPAPASREQATAFYQTMFPAGAESGYDLQLVRVRVPRRTLASFGFRVAPAELDEPVKADLLMGPDGLARAIRFVQD